MAIELDTSTVEPEPGPCCFEPTEFQQFKFKLYLWYNFKVTSILNKTINKYRIGKTNDAIEDTYIISQLNAFINYLISIRYKMVCSGESWETYISVENIKKIEYKLFCLGFDIRCAFQIADIYYTDCCDNIVIPTECPCEEDVPLQLPTEILNFDKTNPAPQSQNYTGTVGFNCCDGSTTLVTVAPTNLGGLPIDVVLNIASSPTKQFDFTISLDHTEVFDTEIPSATLVFTFTACGKTFTKTIIVNVLCADVFYPTPQLPTFAKTWDFDDGVVSEEVVDTDAFSCCNGSSWTVENIEFRVLNVPSGLYVNPEFFGISITTKLPPAYTESYLSPNLVEDNDLRIYYNFDYSGG